MAIYKCRLIHIQLREINDDREVGSITYSCSDRYEHGYALLTMLEGQTIFQSHRCSLLTVLHSRPSLSYFSIGLDIFSQILTSHQRAAIR
jgi:hypothetical protein